jgi:cytochrome c2
MCVVTTCAPAVTPSPAKEVPGGDATRGRMAIKTYGCGACHAISGIPGARGQVGPPLDGFAGRASTAGKLANTPDNLVGWIRSPQSLEPGGIMPDMGVTEADARDIAAYLYRLR